MSNRIAECFKPCEYILEELETRGWGIVDFEIAMGIDNAEAEEIIRGKYVGRKLAKKLGECFGMPFMFWLELQRSYDKWMKADK